MILEFCIVYLQSLFRKEYCQIYQSAYFHNESCVLSTHLFYKFMYFVSVFTVF